MVRVPQLSSSRMVQLGAERKVLTLIRNFVIEIFVERDCGEKRCWENLLYLNMRCIVMCVQF